MAKETIKWEEKAPYFASMPIDKPMEMTDVGKGMGLPTDRRKSSTLYLWAKICIQRGWMEKITGVKGKSTLYVRRKDFDPKHLWRFYQEHMSLKTQEAKSKEVDTKSLPPTQAPNQEPQQSPVTLAGLRDALTDVRVSGLALMAKVEAMEDELSQFIVQLTGTLQ